MGELIDVRVVLQRRLDTLTVLVYDSRLSRRTEVYSERLHPCLAKAEHMSRSAKISIPDYPAMCPVGW